MQVLSISACAPLADYVERTGNKVADRPAPTSTIAARFHDGLLVADLHADTLLWRRGLVENNPDSQVDLARMAKGNLGLQVFTMATRVPLEGRCIHAGNFDPAPLLALMNGWPAPTWSSAYERALHQAEALNEAVRQTNASPPPVSGKNEVGFVHVTFIQSKEDLGTWLHHRYRAGKPDPGTIGVLLGAEGAHAFDDPDGPEFERLFQLGLRMVAPTHRFDNDYGGSSEGCIGGPLTDKGVRLINTAIRRKMVVDLAHASQLTFYSALEILAAARHPAVVSHSGLQGYLDKIGVTGGHRANSDDELIRLAQTGGVFGVGFWAAAIGTARVDNIVGTILHAVEVLRTVEEAPPTRGGSHTVKKASEHVALGSDWDGAVEVAIDPVGLASITERLLERLGPDDVANIMGLNTCRVIAQSFGADDYDASKKICSVSAAQQSTSPGWD
jgi:microsomal dipeptidase-like Zn-dependent dipeptidase